MTSRNVSPSLASISDLGHPHARAEAAVELEHDRLVERRVPFGQRVEFLHLPDRLDLGLRQHAGLALRELAVVVAERVDRCVGKPFAAHLLDAGLQPLHRGQSTPQPRR
jgi:hypothetical protein